MSTGVLRRLDPEKVVAAILRERDVPQQFIGPGWPPMNGQGAFYNANQMPGIREDANEVIDKAVDYCSLDDALAFCNAWDGETRPAPNLAARAGHEDGEASKRLFLQKYPNFKAWDDVHARERPRR